MLRRCSGPAGCTWLSDMLHKPCAYGSNQNRLQTAATTVRSYRYIEYRCACLRVSMRSDMPCSLYLCCHVAQTLCKPVHTTVFRTACRQLQLTNSRCQHAMCSMHACLRVLTRSDMPCRPVPVVLETLCKRQATQQPADSSKQHLIKTTCSVCCRHLCTCCNVFRTTNLAGCTRLLQHALTLHACGTTSQQTAATEHCDLHNMLWNIRIPIPVCQFGRTHISAWLC
jgi:hypothetical protein